MCSLPNPPVPFPIPWGAAAKKDAKTESNNMENRMLPGAGMSSIFSPMFFDSGMSSANRMDGGIMGEGLGPGMGGGMGQGIGAGFGGGIVPGFGGGMGQGFGGGMGQGIGQGMGQGFGGGMGPGFGGGIGQGMSGKK